MKTLIFTAASILCTSVALAALPELAETGSVENAAGSECTFTQITAADGTHFFGQMESPLASITFEDPKCLEYTTENVELLNKMVADWYPGGSDTYNVAAAQLSPGGADQQRGQCITPAADNPLGIAIDHVVEDGSVTELHHSYATSACNNDDLMMMLEVDIENDGTIVGPTAEKSVTDTSSTSDADAEKPATEQSSPDESKAESGF